MKGRILIKYLESRKKIKKHSNLENTLTRIKSSLDGSKAVWTQQDTKSMNLKIDEQKIHTYIFRVVIQAS